jgi:hypothetical protein
MTTEEELATAYANLKGHQDRSAEYIRQGDWATRRIAALEDVVFTMKFRPSELERRFPELAAEYKVGDMVAPLRVQNCLNRIAEETRVKG